MRLLIFILLITQCLTEVISDDILVQIRDLQQKINKRISYGSSKEFKDKIEVPSFTRVYSQDDLKMYSSVYEILSHIAGISVEEGQFNSEYINARGHQNFFYDTKVLFNINGLRFASKMTSANKVNIIPISAIKRLEVSMGAASALYGSNAYSLEIFITTLDKYEYPESFIKTTIGGFGTTAYEGALVNGNLITAFEVSRNIFENNNPSDSDTYNPTNKMINTKELRDFTLMYNTDNFSVLAGTSKNTLDFRYEKEDFSGRSPIFLPLSPGWHGTKSTFENNFFSVKHRYFFNDNLVLRSFGRYLNYSRDLLSDSLPYYNYEMGSKSINTEFQLHWNIDSNNSLIAGYSYDNSKYFHKTDTKEINQLLIPPALRTSLGIPAPITHLYQVLNNGVPFPDTFYMVKPGKDISKGLFLRYSTKLNDRLTVINTGRIDNNETFRTTQSYKNALVWEYNRNSFLKVIKNKAFRYPHQGEAEVEIPWVLVVRSPQDIHEESIDSLEYIWSKKYNSAYINVSYSNMKVSGGIYMVQSSNPPFIHPGNLHEYESNSWEVEYHKNWGKLRSTFDIAFNDKKALDQIGDKERPGEIKRTLSVLFDWKLSPKHRIHYGLDHVGPRMESLTDSSGFAVPSGTYAGSYTKHYIKYLWSPNKKIDWQLSITNLFNKETHFINYLIADGHENPLPSPRMITLSAKFKF